MVLISLSNHYSCIYLTMLARFGLMILSLIIDCSSKGTLVKDLKGNPYRLFYVEGRSGLLYVQNMHVQVSSLIHNSCSYQFLSTITNSEYTPNMHCMNFTHTCFLIIDAAHCEAGYTTWFSHVGMHIHVCVVRTVYGTSCYSQRKDVITVIYWAVIIFSSSLWILCVQSCPIDNNGHGTKSQ